MDIEKSRRRGELIGMLADEGYIGSKAIDALVLEGETVDDILAVLARYRRMYGDTLIEKQAWRDEINELEEEKDGTP